MQNHIYLLLNQIKGDWLLQENFYFPCNKQQRKYKEKISFLKNSQINKLNISNNLIENINNKKLLFKLEKVKENLVTITRTNRNEQVNYKEYIYIINNNFMISLIIIKNLHKKQYVGLKISSYIRFTQE
uniref:hypothetical protein orf128 n=1 Tax=Tayloriella tenebrosa TaxID=1917049 RepID=UPI0022FD840C|nr:hypothetical protein orf128 [Tayloriella tenebrosa]WAX03660.1 hypothetical protein orf128 [Tayloriella tenebrosa]